VLCALRDSFSMVSRSEVTGTLGEGFCLFQNFWFFTNFESCFMCSFAIFTYYFTLLQAGGPQWVGRVTGSRWTLFGSCDFTYDFIILILYNCMTLFNR
jgi:hypothetical protein